MGCGAGSTCIEGCPSSAEPSVGAVGGICSVPGRDTCGCGAVADPCDTPGTVCLMPACCDYEGICVTPTERAEICSRPESTHFDCSGLDAGSGGAGGSGGGGSDGGYGDGGFTADFTARANTALAAGAPSWVCATTLPNVPVADAAAARDAVRQFIAQVVGVPSTDIAVTVQNCGSGTATCAVTFAHDCAKSGGNIYNTVAPLADELNATATSVEETIWVPMQNGMSFAADVVLSGISDGLLVGMVDFNYPTTCP
jgi:hypothetical protein